MWLQRPITGGASANPGVFGLGFLPGRAAASGVCFEYLVHFVDRLTESDDGPVGPRPPKRANVYRNSPPVRECE